jgi:hypothetical protein
MPGLPSWCFPTLMMSAQMDDAWPPLMMFSNLYDVCSTGWYLAYIHDVFQPVWCSLNCMISSQLSSLMSGYSYEMSTKLYDVCLPVLCFPTCTISRLLVWVHLPVRNQLNCKMSAYMYDVFLPVWGLTTCMMSAQLYEVWLLVWCLLYCTMFSLPV